MLSASDFFDIVADHLILNFIGIDTDNEWYGMYEQVLMDKSGYGIND